jgi:periplasmic divalent cation tolerance protein
MHDETRTGGRSTGGITTAGDGESDGAIGGSRVGGGRSDDIGGGRIDGVSGGIVEIRTTFAVRDEAETCAALLVDRRLAACVQVEGPVQSTYRWQGAIERAEEFRCTVKTTAVRAAACIDAIRRGHPYENPELLVAEVAAGPAYAAWVRESVAAGAGEGGG